MSIKLRDLIKSVRQTKTAADERNIIAKESAALRTAFKNQDPSHRHRNVAKLMYIHMLGYPTHFGQMECLKLIASPTYPEKRIGYLALMLLLDERTEVLMLVTNSVKNDLSDKSQYIVGLALCALGNVGSTEMCRDLAPEVEKLLGHTNPYIRKKAALCALRTIRRVPDMVEEFQEKAPDLLNDRHHGVLLCGCTLLLAICEQAPAAAAEYASQTKLLVKVLKQLVLSAYSPEHDVGGINDPFLQCRILRLLRHLGAGNPEASDIMSDILAQVATNTEPTRNAGNSILYECVQTIMGIESTQGLRVLAINIMGRFLSNKDNNIRYVALNTLAKVVTVDTQAVQRHRATVVNCVKDADVSIRRRALELVYALINETNIKTLTDELLEYLKVSDASFKPDLTQKIALLVQKFAPDRRWYVDNMVSLLVQAGAFVKPEIWRSLIVVVSNTPELQGYVVRSLYRAVTASLDKTSSALMLVSVWTIGEYGDVLVDPTAPLQPAEEPLRCTGGDLVRLMEVLLSSNFSDPEAREYILTALVKLAAHVPSTRSPVEVVVKRCTASSLLEVQQRSCEFERLFRSQNPALFGQLLEHMPALNEAEYMKATVGSNLQSGEDSIDLGHPRPKGSAAADSLADLLGGDIMGESPAAPTAAAPTGGATGIEDLLGLDLMGGPPAPAPASAPGMAAAPAVGGALNLDDLLGGGMAPGPAPAAVPAGVPGLGGLDFFRGGPAPAPAASASQFPPVTAYQKDNLLVSLSFSKPDPSQPGLTDIAATVTNSGASPVGNFSLQAAVPKFIQLRLDPASGSALAPGGQPVTQSIHLTNSMQGHKPIALRLRISYVIDGRTAVEMCEVSNLPPGL